MERGYFPPAGTLFALGLGKGRNPMNKPVIPPVPENNIPANALTRLEGMSGHNGQYADSEGRLVQSMRMIERSVCTITAVLHEMKILRDFDVVSYHDRAKILDIDAKVKRRMETMLPS